MCGTCGCDERKPESHAGKPAYVKIDLNRRVLERNVNYAEQNRRALQGGNRICINILSSPGSGKTSLLEKTLELSAEKNHIGVIEGDQYTDNDAQRLKKYGVEALQINTGKNCHLDAHSIHHALEDTRLQTCSLIFVENVGNLICPAMFDLGETKRVALLSVTEGEDKPLKYPEVFAHADLLLISKMDLLPYVPFDLDICIENALKINSCLKIIKLSTLNGEGLNEWLGWLDQLQVPVCA